ncbi:rRNA-processing protein fcf1 [Penicillium ochrochloron]|uniref:rRNA-processing protein FCF1-like protein n=1 Tax=Penicillium subrubescens TaxID=1316194 RepID=A0A1Q5TGW5_9EURO|nr:rRNA-processing protein FCF1 [Penicillium subrubescens]KAJ5886314.1 rRNA-processing protein FCF1 [Penicillium subrubescens]OKO99460.1 rRNA-processing protein FCF1 -like protein [Penicillium subrubescens]
MGVQKKTRKFAVAKRTIQLRDSRLKANDKTDKNDKAGKSGKDEVVREAPQAPSSLFFQYNTALSPPYSVLVDTNFISHTIQHKLEVIPTMMDCLYAKCIPIITDCVLAELEKLGQKYRLALRVAKDPRFERIKCDHKGTYADDCLVDRVIKHRVYIVATNDRDLKRRIRKIPGAPIMSVARGKYVIERLPDAPEK